MKEKALAYLKKGVSVMPLLKNKEPLLLTWKEFMDRLPTEKEVTDWWTKWPEANIGIITGKVSGLSVVDVDVRKGGVLDIFPQNTTLIKTGNGGYHLYYKYHEGLGNRTEILKGIDIRSDRGYVVAPPSVTDYIDKETGVRMGGSYSVIKALPFSIFPVEKFPDLNGGKKEAYSISSAIGTSTGSRNATLASVIGKLIRYEPTEKWNIEIFPVVETINRTFQPPLSDYELKTTFNSIASTEKKRRDDFNNQKDKIASDSVKKYLENIKVDLSKVDDDKKREEGMKRLIEVAKIYAGEDRLESSYDVLERIKNEPEEMKIFSGWEKLDKILRGFRLRQLVVISAYTKHGKTTWLLDLTRRIKEHNPVWIPLEEGSEDLVRKCYERKQDIPYWFAPKTITKVNLEWVESKIVEGIAKHNTRVVIIDQLDFIVPLQMKDHHQMIGETVRAVRSLARKWNVCIFIVCHLNGQAKMTMQPSVENLKGSTSIQQEADTAILIWRETKREHEEIIQTNNTLVSVQANRRSGTTGNVKMFYKEEDGKYYEGDWKDKDLEKFVISAENINF